MFLNYCSYMPVFMYICLNIRAMFVVCYQLELWIIRRNTKSTKLGFPCNDKYVCFTSETVFTQFGLQN